MCMRANFGYFSTCGVDICRSVFIGKDNIPTKFRANPMHFVHVVHARMCTQAILGYFFVFSGLLRLEWMLEKTTQLEPNITGFSWDFKRARYQKLAFVDIVTYCEVNGYHLFLG